MAVSVIGSINREHYLTKISAGENTIFSDEPVWNGGTEKGMNPFELLAASLIACTCATMRMYIDRKKWEVDGIEVEVDLERSEDAKTTSLDRRITLIGNISEEQRERLLVIANSCPVHRILTHQIDIKTRLI